MSPLEQEEWESLQSEVIQAFTPGTSIKEAELLAGRSATIRQLQLAMLDEGRHALIYGERGVGKTSIANTFHKPLNTPTSQVLAIQIFCDSADSFDSLWRKVFRRIKVVSDDGEEGWADEAHPAPLSVDDVVTELGSFSRIYCPIVIVDEFDRLRDPKCKLLVADVIKALSDYGHNCTLVLVGVARSVGELIANHASVSRALLQVPMQRLGKSDLGDIVNVRLRRLGMKIEPRALWRISFLSAGLPFYTHALGRNAALRAIHAKKKTISEKHVFEAMQDCVADVDQTIKEAYVKATEKIYRKSNIYDSVVAACALAETDAVGKFSALSVESPLGEILGKPMKSSSFASHLNELSKPDRGSILERTGERGKLRFSFVEPLMQPFVLVTSLNKGLISESMMSLRIAEPQMRLGLA